MGVSRLGVAFVVCGLVGVADSAFAAQCVWTGGGGDTRWSTAANWGCGRAPQNGDTVLFIAGQPKASNQNDIPGLVLARMVIAGASGSRPPVGGPPGGSLGQHWDIGGVGVTLTGELNVDIASDERGQIASVRLPITLGSAASLIITRQPGEGGAVPFRIEAIDLNGFAFTFNLSYPVVAGGIAGSGTVIKTGPDVLTLNDNTYAGVTQINQGPLIVAATHSLGATGDGANETVIANGAALSLASNVTIDEALTINSGASVALRAGPGVTATLNGSMAMPADARVFLDTDSRVTIAGAVAASGRTFNKEGAGTLVVSNPANAWDLLRILAGTVVVGAAGAMPDTGRVGLASTSSRLDLNNINETIGPLELNGQVLLGSGTLTINVPDLTFFAGTIAGTGGVVKTGAGFLFWQGNGSNSYTGTTTVQRGVLFVDMPEGTKAILGPIVVNRGVLSVKGDVLNPIAPVTVNAQGRFETRSDPQGTSIGSLAGAGTVTAVFLSIGADNTSTTFSGIMELRSFEKVGSGTLTLTGAAVGNSPEFTPRVTVRGGTLIVNGPLDARAFVDVDAGTLGGVGRVGSIGNLNPASPGAIRPGPGPGPGPGLLRAEKAELHSMTFVVELNGPNAGDGYDQLELNGGLTLFDTSTLQVTRGFGPSAGTSFTIVSLPEEEAVTGTFAGLPEGALLTIGGQKFGITYRGGDGNDVVLTALEGPPVGPPDPSDPPDPPDPTDPPVPPPITYYLSEGATGDFFDDDVLIANPNDKAAPVTLTFSKENGEQVVDTRAVPAQSHLTVHVDAIAGLEETAASVQVRSDAGLPLVVERSMFWDKTYYAGHTGSAVDKPAADWFFAEGSQGFFDVFVLVINPNATPADVTFTFFRENEPPVVKTLAVGATTRLTLYAGDVPELVDSSFGIAVHATQPIMAERSMYFGDAPARSWSGGHESAGVTAASTHWFLAEGATGSFFDTFILLSNPQSTPAQVTLQYLLDTGETVTVPKTIAANARLTTNIEVEDDPRLHNAAVSTVVTADVPIIAERSMYWPGAPQPWREGHNSFGVVDAATKWGLGEGRVGGPLNFHTYILLANPQPTAANVTVTFLRENGAPVLKTYTVPPTSRFNVDTSEVTELRDESFGAVIQVTNGVPIIVERSIYWDSNGIQFSGGTNATGIRLP